MTRFHKGIGGFADLYDGFIVDQWGVLHNGAVAYPGAIDCLAKLKQRGKRVVILSNSGKRAELNANRMTRIGIAPGAYTGLVTSGEVARTLLRERRDPLFAQLGKQCLLIRGGDDISAIEGLDLGIVDHIEQADFVLVTGLTAGARIDAFDHLLVPARERSLPLICANPDIVGVSASGLTASPGALAQRYQTLGGRVRFIGKPYPDVYEACRAMLGDLDEGRLIAVGDSLQHDVAGGVNAGIATAFVIGGIHAEEIAAGDTVERLASLGEQYGAVPDRAVPLFIW